MEYIDNYFSRIYHIRRTYSDPSIPDDFREAVKTDILKTMVIGSVFFIGARFCIYTRYYLFKNYVASAGWGCAFGAAYSPYFLDRKADS